MFSDPLHIHGRVQAQHEWSFYRDFFSIINIGEDAEDSKHKEI